MAEAARAAKPRSWKSSSRKAGRSRSVMPTASPPPAASSSSAARSAGNGQCQFETDELVGQVRQTLENVVAVVAEAGGGPEHITSMTWYFVDKRDYLANLKGIGEAYRAVIGRHYPAMAAIQVVALMEDRAKVEIQAYAVIPE